MRVEKLLCNQAQSDAFDLFYYFANLGHVYIYKCMAFILKSLHGLLVSLSFFFFGLYLCSLEERRHYYLIKMFSSDHPRERSIEYLPGIKIR